MSPGALSGILSGRRTPRAQTLHTLSQVLGIDPSALVLLPGGGRPAGPAAPERPASESSGAVPAHQSVERRLDALESAVRRLRELEPDLARLRLLDAILRRLCSEYAKGGGHQD
jgi:transcriptional regulator with XRE-family HTH domain